jgi:ubiquinone/menaquinone biosynthesis C-methylase UbiE
MGAPASADEIKDVNVRYHDAAACDYDEKWGITYRRGSQAQVKRKLRKALGRRTEPFERALEIGAGTGYFTLNLMRAGLVREGVCTDISAGMLDELARSADRLGLRVETACCDAEALPFDDESFDLVVGHAILHHVPDLHRAFREFHRVLRPGGEIVFCGEPSLHGDRLATVPKQAARAIAPVGRTLMRASRRGGPADGNGHAGSANGDGDHGLEWAVDVHAFTPGDLARPARAAGFDEVRVTGEELTASWFGWANRTLEGTAESGKLPRLWYRYAHQGYLALQQVDRALLEPRLPAAVFYNLLMSGRKPA